MSLLSRLFASRGDDRAALRPLWHRLVAIAREPEWYRDAGIADTLAGRFDAVTMVLSAALLRMEGEPALTTPTVRLTELFVDDMDGQLRESGVGDLAVGKHVGKLMSVLGGRLGAYRSGLAGDDGALAEAVARNVTLVAGGDPRRVAERLRALASDLAKAPAEALLAGAILR